MLRLSRRLTLFPYTTLFRSLFRRGKTARHRASTTRESRTGARQARIRRGVDADPDRGWDQLLPAGTRIWAMPGSRSSPAERSEEHTSELQSLRHLVCRLLLE